MKKNTYYEISLNYRDKIVDFSQTKHVFNSLGGMLVTKHKPKPDDRSDNVEKLQEMVQNTIGNMRQAEETMHVTDDEESRVKIAAKNDRRFESIQAMRDEISDEATADKDASMSSDENM